MTKKIIYTKGKITGRVKIVENFLPKPEDLVLTPRSSKITIDLTQTSIDFFKNLAAKYHIPYQRIIRTLLDQYATNDMNKKKH